MEYGCSDSFLFDVEPNGIQFGLKSKGKPPPRSYPILCERKWKGSFLSLIQVTFSISCGEDQKKNVSWHQTQTGGEIKGKSVFELHCLHVHCFLMVF